MLPFVYDCLNEFFYARGIVIIYYNNIDTVKELLQTIIHEWTHSLQPLTSKWKEYNDIAYSRNPYEREAYASEVKYKELWNVIKHKLNK